MHLPLVKALMVGGVAIGTLLTLLPFAWSAEPEVGSDWTVAPLCYRYAFVSDRQGGADNIFYSDSCTNQTQQLTSNRDPQVHYTDLSMSHSIARIAFHESNSNGKSEWLNFVDADTGSLSLLNADANSDGIPDFMVSQSTWGPNNQFVFIESDLQHQDFRVRINDQWPFVPSQTRTLISADPTGSRVFGGLDWIPFSNRFLLSMAPRGESFRLYVVDTDSSHLWPLQETETSDERAFAMVGESPSVSRSGKLAFVRDGQIVTCDLDNSQVSASRPQFFCKNRQVVFQSGVSQSPCWTYDHQKIIFSGNPQVGLVNDQSSDLYMINPNGTELKKLTDYPGKETEPVCFPFGY